MKTSKNKRTETSTEQSKIVSKVNTKEKENNDLQVKLDAIMEVLKDIRELLEKKKPLTSLDL